MSIILKDLEFKINNKKIIENFNLNILDNKIIMLLGLNGAGKSTLIKMLIGALFPTSGEIILEGQKLKEISMNKRAKLMAYVPQVMDINYNFLVEEFINLGNLGNDSNLFDKVISSLNISHLKDKNINSLSTGELRSCYLARALVQNTKWLILDEPTASLDYKREYEFLKLLESLKLKENKSIILSIHNPTLALEFADALVFIKDGTNLGILENTKENRTLINDKLVAIYGPDLINSLEAKGVL